MNWNFFATLAAGMLESAGIAKQNEDENNTGKDDVIGDALVFAAKFLRWLATGALGKAPKMPDSVASKQ